MKWTPDLVIALIIIVACLGLRFTGIDSEVWSVMLIAVGWVFGGQYQVRKAAKGGT